MKALGFFACRMMLLAAIAILAVNVVILSVTFPIVGYALLAGAAWRFWRRGGRVSGNYGTARAADRADLVRGRMLCKSGLILGRAGSMPVTRGQAIRSLVNPKVDSERACRELYSAFLGRSGGGDEFIRVDQFNHLLTVSPAGGGKSVGTLVPNLLSYDGNCVVVDPKGELFSLTAEHRKKQFGHTIVRLDPARLFDRQHGPGDCLNPLDWINPLAPDFIDRCRDLANMIVMRTGQEHEAHFLDSSENMIAAFCAYICAAEGNPAARNLRGVRTLLASRELYTGTLIRMQENNRFHGVLKQLGHSLNWHVERELASVMSTVQRQSNIFESPLVAAATARTSFDPTALRSGKMTIYLIVPAEYLSVWAALQRVLLGTLLRLATRGVPTEKNPVLFMIDEAAHIGRMRALEDAPTLLRGMGIRLWFFFQSLDQLKKCFGDNAPTVLDNLGTQQYFGINSYETAEAISKRIGEETRVIRTEGGNSGSSTNSGSDGKGGTGTSRGSSYNVSEIARRWLKPEEFLVLPPTTALVFHKNSYVVMCDRITYYADQAFRRGWKGFGTGKTRGLGLRGLALALVALLLSFMASAFVEALTATPARQPGFSPYSQPPVYGPAPYPPYGGGYIR